MKQRSFKRITLEEAKEYSPMLGYEILNVCPQCEFYLVTEFVGLGKPERIVTMTFECESRREERERRRRAREMGEHALIYADHCLNEDRTCYVLKEIEKSSGNVLTSGETCVTI